MATELLGAVLWISAQRATAAVGEGWDGGAIADALAAWLALDAGNTATAAHDRTVIQMANAVGASWLRAEATTRGVLRSPRDLWLHSALRDQILANYGAAALDRFYSEPARPIPDEAKADWAWLHGYALVQGVAPRLRFQGDLQDADAALSRAVGALDQSVVANDSYVESAQHYACLARAQQAELRTELKQWGKAVDAVVDGAKRSAGSFDSTELGTAPRAVAVALRAALRRGKQADLIERLEQGLEAAGVALR